MADGRKGMGTGCGSAGGWRTQNAGKEGARVVRLRTAPVMQRIDDVEDDSRAERLCLSFCDVCTPKGLPFLLL